MAEGIDLTKILEMIRLTIFGDQVPEWAAAQVEEGQGKVALAPFREDFRPVIGKQAAQFRRYLDQVGLDARLGEQIQDGQQQQGLVRRTKGGGSRPMFPVFIQAQPRELQYKILKLH